MGPSSVETPGFHGMALVGRRRAYLSPLPMFMVPHDNQAILRGDVVGGRRRPVRCLPLDLQQGPTTSRSSLAIPARSRAHETAVNG
jgi:hypothetical protein